MSYRKNKIKRERLRLADSDISADSAISSVNGNLLEKYTQARGNVSSVFSKRNKFPLALDIIISVLLILLVIAIVVGGYFLMKRFDDSYDSKDIEYVLLIDISEIDGVNKGDNLYVDKDGSAIYFGRVTEIDDKVIVTGKDETVDYVLVTLHATVQYRDDDGYSLDGERIAIGKEISARVDDDTFSGEIVRLSVRKDTDN